MDILVVCKWNGFGILFIVLSFRFETLSDVVYENNNEYARHRSCKTQRKL